MHKLEHLEYEDKKAIGKHAALLLLLNTADNCQLKKSYVKTLTSYGKPRSTFLPVHPCNTAPI